jgi:serine/threonine-protein kinase HipA
MSDATKRHITDLAVFMAGTPVGRLATDRDGVIYFDYDPAWAATGRSLAPWGSMGPDSLGQGPFTAPNDNFNGLHGPLNDALPDGWGLLLMDRALKQSLGWDAGKTTPLDRLAYMGERAMGALEFRPAMGGMVEDLPDLGDLAAQAEDVQADGSGRAVAKALLIHGGSPGGARPKATLAANDDWSRCVSGFGSLPEGYSHWIVKFRARNQDAPGTGRAERAYAEMAVLAGIEMPQTRLIETSVRGRKEVFFAVRRFDREGADKRHVVSLGGMLDASHRVPCVNYGDVLKATQFATGDVREVAKVFRLMLFNVLAHNKDDHVKNFSFILNATGNWCLSPAYDLTFNEGMRGGRMTALDGGRGARGGSEIKAVGALAERFGVRDWGVIMTEVLHAVSLWRDLAVKWKVPARMANLIEKGLLSVGLRKDLDPAATRSGQGKTPAAGRQR